jgi:hypothetical protein
MSVSHKTEQTLKSVCGVTDVLIASLTDTMAEHPQMLSVTREGLLDGSSGHHLLHQLLTLNPATVGGDSVSAHLIHKNIFQFTVRLSCLIHRFGKFLHHKMSESNIFSHTNTLQSCFYSNNPCSVGPCLHNMEHST